MNPTEPGPMAEDVVAAAHPVAAPISAPTARPETNEVTVVVATRNRPDQLRQTMRHHRARVIVVDNGSDQPLDVDGAETIHLGDNLGAAARNVGAERARTPFVAFADDDSFWAPGSLARAAALLHAHPRTALLTAQVRIGTDHRLDPISAGMAAAPLGTPTGGAGPSILGFLACAAVVRRDAFLAVGGFNPKLLMYGEEALLAMDLAAAGWQLSYAPHLTVHHFPEPAGRNVRARRRREARNRILTALLRRPPATVTRTVVSTLGTEPTAVAGLLPELRWALRHRRPLPPHVEQALRALNANARMRRQATPGPVTYGLFTPAGCGTPPTRAWLRRQRTNRRPWPAHPQCASGL